MERRLRKDIKKCDNCQFWQFHADPNMGLCKKTYMAFAYTCERTLHPITKNFYVCDEHQAKVDSRTQCSAF